MSEIAIILLRGRIGTHHAVKHTLDLLNIKKKHVCVLVEDNDVNRGMIKKVKDYVTWGIIDEETKKELQEKRGKKDEKGNFKSYYNLNPPKGGFEKKGTKQPFNLGGALGNRKEKINELIKKML